MKEIFLPPELSQSICSIYERMEDEYQVIADQIGLTCTGCPDNCCDSYFLHYTYAEWAYLWQGIRRLDDERLDAIMQRATAYVSESRALIAQGQRPALMCPCNENGMCMIYTHRLMICRMHGIPAALTRPDGQLLRFPGCFRCQEIVGEKYETESDAPYMDRTGLFAELAQTEQQLLAGQRHLYPKVKMTIAEMIAQGPPRVRKTHCEA